MSVTHNDLSSFTPELVGLLKQVYDRLMEGRGELEIQEQERIARAVLHAASKGNFDLEALTEAAQSELAAPSTGTAATRAS
jgi:hypothetical protein